MVKPCNYCPEGLAHVHFFHDETTFLLLRGCRTYDKIGLFFNDDKIACLLLKRGKIPKSFCNNGSFYDDLAKFSWGPWHENFAQSLLQFLVCGPHGDPNETLSEVFAWFCTNPFGVKILWRPSNFRLPIAAVVSENSVAFHSSASNSHYFLAYLVLFCTQAFFCKNLGKFHRSTLWWNTMANRTEAEVSLWGHCPMVFALLFDFHSFAPFDKQPPLGLSTKVPRSGGGQPMFPVWGDLSTHVGISGTKIPIDLQLWFREPLRQLSFRNHPSFFRALVNNGKSWVA